MSCISNYYRRILLKHCIKHNYNKIIQNNLTTSNALFQRCETPVLYADKKDPAPYFFNDEVQNLLKKLTRVNLNKVFRARKLGDRQLETPTYKFMTDDELQQHLQEAMERADEMLQMPPVVKLRDKIECVLSRDPALKGYDSSKYVFTDITYGISDRDRIIVVRDPDGALSKADWDVRHRMNQIYFPRGGRLLKTPKFFEKEYLENLLERREYEFLLENACVQFEPDDPEYQQICSLTYQHVNNNNSFDVLRSTRHFGPLTFYLVWNKETDNLLLELIETAKIAEANSLIELFNRLHESEAVKIDREISVENDTELIEKFVSEKSQKKGQLELALQSYKELLKQQVELETGVKRAHGLT